MSDIPSELLEELSLSRSCTVSGDGDIVMRAGVNFFPLREGTSWPIWRMMLSVAWPDIALREVVNEL